MTRVGRRLIEDFLLPSLNDQRYADRLMWVDKKTLLFSIRWSHKNAAKWSLQDTVVFQDWDKMKGHFHPEIKGYYMQSKQRFRAALYKLNTVRKLRTEDKHIKLYQLVLENDKKRNAEYLGKLEIKKEVDIQNSRPSVICRNTNYVEKNMIATKLHDFRTIQIKNENSMLSGDSTTTYSDSSSSSIDRCFNMSSPSQSLSPTLEVIEAMMELGQDLEKKDVKSLNYSNTIILSPRILNISENVKCEKITYMQLDNSEFSKGNLSFLPYRPQPRLITHENPNVHSHSEHMKPHMQQISPQTDHVKFSTNSSMSNRHLLVAPMPMYNRVSVQKLPPRKSDLLQPVDLSVKREFYEHSNIPVSAR